jgi:hypothetical protein
VVAEGGTHCLVAPGPLGTDVLERDASPLARPPGQLLAGRVLHIGAHGDASPGATGRFVGELSDPMPLTVDDAGSLWVNAGPVNDQEARAAGGGPPRPGGR